MLINFVIWIALGAVIGWLAGIVMRSSHGTLINIAIGIVGALLGGWIFSALGLTGANINQGNFSPMAVLVSFVGAVILLGVVNLIQRGRLR